MSKRSLTLLTSTRTPGAPASEVTAVRLFVVPLLALLCLVAACSSSPAVTLPAGKDLVAKSAQAMRTVKTVAFTIATEGKPPVPVKHAEGTLTGQGAAKGTIQIQVLGNLQELNFVLTGDTVYFKGPTGGYQTMTRQQLAGIYDPSAILDPDKGVAHLLATASDPRTEAEEKVGGTDAYRVAVTLSQQVIATLVPGVGQGVNGRVWIDKATGRLVKTSLPVGTGANAGTVVVTMDDYDAPVTITPPAKQ
ncbi:LppX_LprAFG lipoprotein [Sphaerisporangium fuscum]|uniref:LppX_LprAFG lipoprotein n=1 Tax=Sphaerisporangium fuscum TaxID=2835868 RepID=UPI0027E22A58|nr:LppX_LprAFG lipoprotein [Sphaerisporangium fuscum]